MSKHISHRSDEQLVAILMAGFATGVRHALWEQQRSDAQTEADADRLTMRFAHDGDTVRDLINQAIGIGGQF